MGTINYDIAALCITILNAHLFFSRSRLFVAQTNFFAALLGVTLCATVTDILTVLLYDNASGYPLWFLYAINMLFFLSQNSIPLLVVLFLLSLGGRLAGMKLPLRAVLLLPWAAAMLVVFSTPLTGWAFRFDESLSYIRGPGFAFLYAVVLAYTIVIVVALFSGYLKISRETRFAVFLFLPFCLVSVAIQYVVPFLLVQLLGIAISELVILMTIQDFGKFIDHASGLFNRDGLVAQLELIQRRHVPFSVYIVSLDSVDFLWHVLGPDRFVALERAVGTALFDVPDVNRFASQLSPGAFVLVDVSAGNGEAERSRLQSFFRSPCAVDGQELSVSAHLCAIRFPDDTENAQKIFHVLYHLSGSRNSYPPNTVLSLEDLALGDSSRQLKVIGAIRKAFGLAGFDVYFQPIVSARTGRVVSAEALVRLHDSDLGWIPPDEFIPISELNGTIYRIGEYVLERSCAFLVGLRAQGLHLDYIEVNLSALQCMQANLNASLLTVTRNYGLEPKDICFEITETAAHFSPALLKRNMETLTESGFALAIDDFGTGYSNIAMLMSLPYRVVKLDRSIMLAGEESFEGKVALEEFVAMFHRLGTELVAEGVETPEQLVRMRALDVPLIQGFYYSKPLTPKEFILFLRGKEIVCT